MTQRLLSVIFLLAAIVVFMFWIQPLWDEVGQLQIERDAYLNSISNFRQFRETRDGLLSKYNAIPAQDLDNLRKMIPSTPDSGKIIVQFEDMSAKHGLLLRNINVARQEKARARTIGTAQTPYEIIPVTFVMSGSYRSFRSFLMDVEKSLRIVDVGLISFSAGNLDSYEFSITAQVYWNKLDEK